MTQLGTVLPGLFLCAREEITVFRSEFPSASNWKGHRTVDALLLFRLEFFINDIPFSYHFV
jgi:hypothetical protein